MFKLTQANSVADYYSEFLTLANRVEDITESAMLDCFISGLKLNIKRDVIAQLPSSLLRALSLACLFDEKHKLSMPSTKAKCNN